MAAEKSITEKKKLTAEQKAAMKLFRERRGGVNRTQQQLNRENHKASKAILDCLAAGEATVPELAATTGIPASRVLWHVAAMRKYGQLKEARVDGDYVRYARVESEAKEEA